MKREERLLVKYYRLSMEDEADGESNSIRNQRKLIEDYVEEREDLRELTSLELSDDGYTGTNFNRPGIKRFLDLLKKNQVACLVVKDFSRFTRDYIELGNYAEQIFPFMDVRFISVNDRYDSSFQSSHDGLEIPFKGILNDLYSKDISTKVKAAKRQMIKNGKLCSGSYPFGYRKRERGEIERDGIPYGIDEEAAKVVRLIFHLALQGKKNIEIARVLNEQGCLTPGMAKRKNGSFGYGLKEGERSVWDSTKVLNILRDERYAGTLIIGRYQGKGVGRGKVEEAPEHMWFRKEMGMPAIILREDFERVQSLRPRGKRGTYKKEHHILYRKVRCANCGHFLYYKPSEYGAQYHSFFCKQPHLSPDSKCFRGHIKEWEILEALLNMIRVQVRLAETIKAESKRKGKGEERRQAGKRLERLEREIERKKGLKAQCYSEYKHGELTKEEFLRKKGSIQDEIQVCQQETQIIRESMEDMEEDKKELVERYGGYKDDIKLDREMVERFVKVIWVYDVGRVKIELK